MSNPAVNVLLIVLSVVLDCRRDALADSPESVGAIGQAGSVGLQLDETSAAIAVSRGSTMIVVYNKQSPQVPDGVDPIFQRSGFLHPVASPIGNVVTAVFPFDHLHQDGVFSAWVKTKWNGRKVYFWNLAGGKGRVLHQRVVSTFCNETTVGFEVDLVHRVVEHPMADVLSERWKVTVHSTHSSNHCFDLETTQTALTQSPLVVTRHHYGGIALRGPTDWLQAKKESDGSDTSEQDEPQSEVSDFLTDQGANRIQGNHQKSRWVSLTGFMEGEPVSIMVLGHVANFRAPQSARRHPTKPYFCFAPCVEGEFVIDQDHPFHARYRYLITDAAPDTEWLNQQWRDWCAE
jgi:hypothetical protein